MGAAPPSPPACSSQWQRDAAYEGISRPPAETQVSLLAQSALGVANNCNMQKSFAKIYLFASV